jgi:hypothetical protein
MMARIVDKDTRIIDIDFSEITCTAGRAANTFVPNAGTVGRLGVSQLLNRIQPANYGVGSYIQYVRLDLDFMARNNEIVLPTEASVQRTSPVPLGYSNNGNNFDQIEEFIFILSRPLNNTNLAAATTTTLYDEMRGLGLDGTQTSSALSGNAGSPTQAQTIYAEKRMYSYNESLGATQGNGQLIPSTLGQFEGSPTQGGSLVAIPAFANDYNTLMGMPTLDSVTSWGSMGAITGPNLHCYRMVINRCQSFPALADTFTNVGLIGETSFKWPAVSIRFLCTDPKYSEGEYLTRLANAMNSIAEDGETA